MRLALSGVKGEALKEVKNLSRGELKAWLSELGEPAYRTRQIFWWVYKKGVRSFKEMTNLPLRLREHLIDRLLIQDLPVLRREQSQDGTLKLLLGFEDGRRIESVLIQDGDRFTACLSTQVGCALSCAFCLTGLMGLERNLRAWEIVAQVLALEGELSSGERLGHIVLMGMGEPLANFEATIKALKIIADPEGLAFSPRRITLSTVGLPHQIRRLGAEGLGINIAVSLHAPTDELRDRLVPINRRYPLKELLDACRDYPLPPRRRITFEYVLMGGINDRPKDAHALAKLLEGIRSKINLIPLNEAPEIPFKQPSRDRLLAFQKILHDHGYTATIREPKGWDISAACGMLKTSDSTGKQLSWGE